jgi:hypothetical protein
LDKQQLQQAKRIALESVAADRKMLQTMQSDRRKVNNLRPLQQQQGLKMAMIKLVR